MPSGNSQLPDDGTDLARWRRRTDTKLRQLEAARRLQNTAIGAGGLTVQTPGQPGSIKLVPQGAVEIVPYGSGSAFPPAVEFSSGDPSEITPGVVLTYLADGGGFAIPTVLVMTPDLGNGVSLLKFQGSVPGEGTAAAELVVGGASLILGTGVLYLSLEDGTQLALSGDGVEFATEQWTALPLSSGWTATGGTWLQPEYHLDSTLTVQLVGSITPGTLTAGTVIATLPPGYIPPGDAEYRVPGGSATAYCDLLVHGTEAASPGQITITNVAGTITRVSLSQVSFPL